LGPDRHDLLHFLEQIVQRETGPFQFELRGLDFREIEDVVDEIQQVVPGAAKNLQWKTRPDEKVMGWDMKIV
jgi:hypothetical protein